MLSFSGLLRLGTAYNTGRCVCRPLTFRALSLTATASRGNRDKHDEFFFEREYGKVKKQMDPDMDDPTDILKKMERDQARRERAIKYARAARLFPQPKEERRLLWDTIEQIRFLKQEHPEEWSISRLAASFDVNESVIIRILKSKFVPSQKERQKQDVKAKINMGLLPPGSTVEDEGMMDQCNGSTDSTRLLGDGLSQRKLAAGQDLNTQHYKPSVKPSVKSTYQNKQSYKQRNRPVSNSDSVVTQTDALAEKYASHYQKTTAGEMPSKAGQNHRKEKGKRQTKKWKHNSKPTVMNDDDVNQFGHFEDEYDTAEEEGSYYVDDSTDEPLKVIQKGREFYDENGEFLYRI